MGTGPIILGESGVQVREPTTQEKLDILMNRLDTQQGQILGCLDAINDLSRAMQRVALSPQQRVRFVKEVFKIQLYRTAVHCQIALQAGQLNVSGSFRKLLDEDYKKRAKEVQALSYYHKVMRKLANATLDPEMPDKEFGIKEVKSARKVKKPLVKKS